MGCNIKALFCYTLVGAISLLIAFCPINGLVEASTVGPYEYLAVNQQEWATMTRAERVALCQIPQNIVDSMSTEVLLASVLDYPFMIDLLAFSSFREGFLHVYEEFPALQTLLQRDDFARLAAKQYMEVREGTSANDLVNSIFLGVLMEQPEVLEKISSLSHHPIEPVPNSSALVYTPNGTAVLVTDNMRITDWTQPEKDALNAIYGAAHPTATRLADPSKK